MALVGRLIVACAPHICAACLHWIDGEGLALADCSGGRVYVHDLNCAAAYERRQTMRLPWQTEPSHPGEPERDGPKGTERSIS